MADITLRPAKRSDAADLAILDNLAGFGISLWFWQQVGNLDHVEDAYALGRQRMADDGCYYGWRSATVCVEDEMILGMSTCYISPDNVEDEDDDVKRATPAFAPVFELYDLTVGDWVMDSLAVYPHARGKGAGGLLMDDFVTRGKTSGAKRMSLVAEDANATALQLYASRGFEVSDQRAFIEFDGPAKTKEWLLMTARL